MILESDVNNVMQLLLSTRACIDSPVQDFESLLYSTILNYDSTANKRRLKAVFD